MLTRTVRVLKYCARLFELDNPPVLFSPVLWLGMKDIRWSVIPRLDWRGWNIFVNKEAPRHLLKWGDYALCVHEDGFPINLDMWSGEYMDYDYVGAPWDPAQCGGWPVGSGWGSQLMVGNGGFFLQSRRMMEACLKMPETREIGTTASDVYVCRIHRKWFEDQGIKFAPPEIAARFSTEQTHKTCPSFGFHGRRDSPIKYTLGWKLIEENESQSTPYLASAERDA